MVPDGWETTTLSAVSEKISDGIHSTPNYAENTEYFFVNGNNLKNGRIVIAPSTKCVDEDEYLKQRKELGDRTLLISINGTIGNVAYYAGESVVLGKSAAFVNFKRTVCREFFYYLLTSDATQQYFVSELTGTTIRNLSLKSIKQTRVHVPPLPEQKKIAEILSTWDKAIETTGKLLANAEAQKRALMQQLLTGKRRLPGFEGREWRMLLISELADVLMGSSPPSSAYNQKAEGVPLLQGNADLRNGRSDPRCYTTVETQLCLPGDTLLSVRAPVGSVARSQHNACVGRGLAAIRAKSLSDQEWVYQLLLWFEPRWARLSQGSTFEAVNGKEIRGLEFIAPCDEWERKNIAEILSAQDEIRSTLINQLAKLRTEKRALMQQLLTGTRRVKP